jgi:antirestriction protein
VTDQPGIRKSYVPKREHIAWLADYGRWRSEHRQALAMLAKVQAAILEREAALESQAAEIHAHELHLQDYEVVEYGPGSPDVDQLEAAHVEFERKHSQARELYEQTKKDHVNIVDEVQKLFQSCQSTESRS